MENEGDISEAISDYGAQAFVLHSLGASLPLVTCSSPHKTSKEKTFCIRLDTCS